MPVRSATCYKVVLIFVGLLVLVSVFRVLVLEFSAFYCLRSLRMNHRLNADYAEEQNQKRKKPETETDLSRRFLNAY